MKILDLKDCDPGEPILIKERFEEHYLEVSELLKAIEMIRRQGELELSDDCN